MFIALRVLFVSDCCYVYLLVRQVPLPNSRPMSVDTKPVAVNEQTVPKPPVSVTGAVESNASEKASTKEPASSESKKSAKPEKKQGTPVVVVAATFASLLSVVCMFVSLVMNRLQRISFLTKN